MQRSVEPANGTLDGQGTQENASADEFWEVKALAEIQALREELIRLIDQLPEEQLQGLLKQTRQLSQVQSPLLRLRGVMASGRKDGAAEHDRYMHTEGIQR